MSGLTIGLGLGFEERLSKDPARSRVSSISGTHRSLSLDRPRGERGKYSLPPLMAAVPVLWLLCSASALATVISSRDAELGEPVISRGGAADSESAAIAMASLCRKAGLQGLTRWVDEHALSMTHELGRRRRKVVALHGGYTLQGYCAGADGQYRLIK